VTQLLALEYAKPKTNIKAVWSEGKVDAISIWTNAGKIGNCQRFYFGAELNDLHNSRIGI
jgi:hypothetical protein